MKKCVFGIIAIMIVVLSGCQSADMVEYQQPPRLNYAGEFDSEGTITVVEFSDADYLNKVDERLDSVEVTLLGDVLETPLTYCMTVKEDTATKLHSQVTLEKQYVFPAGVYTSWFKYKAKRPEVVGKKHRTYIVFDVDNPAFQFLPGLKEALSCVCEVTFNLEPIGPSNTRIWDANYLGEYSNGKYMFIMDTFKKLYKNLTLNAQLRVDAREAYATYKANGGEPIMDDQDTPQEIVFP